MSNMYIMNKNQGRRLLRALEKRDVPTVIPVSSEAEEYHSYFLREAKQSLFQYKTFTFAVIGFMIGYVIGMFVGGDTLILGMMGATVTTWIIRKEEPRLFDYANNSPID